MRQTKLNLYSHIEFKCSILLCLLLLQAPLVHKIDARFKGQPLSHTNATNYLN